MGIAYNPKAVSDGLVLALDAANTKSYPGAGTKWTDLSGNGYHATINPLYQIYNSNNGGYFSFISDGSGAQAATIANNVASLLSATNTVEFTMYKTNTQGQILTNNFYGYGESNVVFAKNGTTSVALGVVLHVWEHYAITYNTSTITVYKNGVIGASTSGFDMSGLTGSVFLGARPWSPTAQNFRLGILKIYNRPLSANEIQQNFSALRGRYGI
jgi:hypothetical protein